MVTVEFLGPIPKAPITCEAATVITSYSIHYTKLYDIEVDAKDIDRFCDTVAAIAPTFGGINLEDIKAPECFEIEKRLVERRNNFV